MVRDLRGQVAFFADADGFADGVFYMISFIAHVGLVHAAQGADDFGEFDDFFGVGEVAGHVEKSSGEAERAIEHGLFGERAHAVEFSGCRLAID